MIKAFGSDITSDQTWVCGCDAGKNPTVIVVVELWSL